MADIADNSVILDGFGGSCSLLFAAELCEKRAVIFELEPHYVEKALEVYAGLYPEREIIKL